MNVYCLAISRVKLLFSCGIFSFTPDSSIVSCCDTPPLPPHPLPHRCTIVMCAFCAIEKKHCDEQYLWQLLQQCSWYVICS